MSSELNEEYYRELYNSYLDEPLSPLNESNY